MRMIIISGLSGSGKSIALQTLEDLNYYCVDNLPLELLTAFAKTMFARDKRPFKTTVVGIDARNFLDELERFPAVLDELRGCGLDIEVVFLQASDQILVQRYSETRRKHPLSLDGAPLLDAIRRERQLLEAIIVHATLIVDTSHTNVHELRKLLSKRLCGTSRHSLSLLFESFGFKNGVPSDADFVFDVRCLPNPHWEPKLKSLTGLDEAVAVYLAGQPEVKAMISDIELFFERWLPQFEADDRSYLTVAIGCTGGQHRSVYIAAQLAQRFAVNRANVITRHRELLQ